MVSVLIIGANRGLGGELTKQYAARGDTVYGTVRSPGAPSSGDFPEGVKWLSGVDLTKPDVGDTIAQGVGPSVRFDTVIISAGHFTTEDLEDKGPNWDEEVLMYTTSSVAPVFVVHRLYQGGFLAEGSKIVLVSSESGSIALRHEKEGGGNYAHHASKAALNMVGKLLSLDLKEKGIIVSIIHPGFMRTEMTAGVGFDKYWDDGGAVTPGQAAESLVDWAEKLDMSKTGQYWAPRGPRDIGTAEPVLGTNLPTPLQLPW